MPAMQEDNVAPSSASHTSVSPDPNADEMDTTEDATSVNKRIRLPPIVDFTGFRPDGTSRPTTDPSAYKDAGGGMRGSPAMSAYHYLPQSESIRQDQGQQAHLPAQDDERRRQDRLQVLMREAELMRAALRAKEREIDELER